MSHTTVTHDQILELGQQWATAELRGDAEALGALLDTDFVCVGPLGFVLDREQYLAGRRSGDLQQQAFAWEGVRVRVYGEAAVAVGSQVQQTTYQGHDASGRFRVTQVYVRQADRWRMVSLHLSPIAQPPAWAGPPR
jgi:ketosteroid isomerase-like protein